MGGESRRSSEKREIAEKISADQPIGPARFPPAKIHSDSGPGFGVSASSLSNHSSKRHRRKKRKMDRHVNVSGANDIYYVGAEVSGVNVTNQERRTREKRRSVKERKAFATKKFTDADVEKVKSHILSIPAYESHYTRRHTSWKYIQSHYRSTKMLQSSKSTIYGKIFHEMNLSTKKPKTGTYYTCDKMQTQIAISCAGEKNSVEEMLANQQLADEAYSLKAIDKEPALFDDSTIVITFDMQQCLPTPYVESSVAIYKGIANQVASCLAKHLNNLPLHVKNVVMYSDTCSGQNKNSHMAALCVTVLKNYTSMESLHHKFLVPGHTHMECDIDHVIIDRRSKLVTPHNKIDLLDLLPLIPATFH
ncbi:hypothetical protein PR048_032029 [Dryococelus australis]|uniref:Uncharacterized protein n=1 Tax=Dryococelus australis TaxID=614101 RepID=A0ABQ9G6Y9_9NEOP|nr:hypothetical protein PR048_032029 [Dryococelus australis]